MRSLSVSLGPILLNIGRKLQIALGPGCSNVTGQLGLLRYSLLCRPIYPSLSLIPLGAYLKNTYLGSSYKGFSRN